MTLQFNQFTAKHKGVRIKPNKIKKERKARRNAERSCDALRREGWQKLEGPHPSDFRRQPGRVGDGRGEVGLGGEEETDREKM